MGILGLGGFNDVIINDLNVNEKQTTKKLTSHHVKMINDLGDLDKNANI